jgi:hypothetical protein
MVGLMEGDIQSPGDIVRIEITDIEQQGKRLK